MKTFRFDSALMERVDRVAAEQGLTRTRVFELALINLLEPVASRGRVVSGAARDRQAALNRAKGL